MLPNSFVPWGSKVEPIRKVKRLANDETRSRQNSMMIGLGQINRLSQVLRHRINIKARVVDMGQPSGCESVQFDQPCRRADRASSLQLVMCVVAHAAEMSCNSFNEMNPATKLRSGPSIVPQMQFFHDALNLGVLSLSGQVERSTGTAAIGLNGITCSHDVRVEAAQEA
jgi:hypothetical protein